MGTRGLIPDNRGNNNQKQSPADRDSIQDSRDERIDNENISDNEETSNNIHNQTSGDITETRVSLEEKLDPKSPISPNCR